MTTLLRPKVEDGVWHFFGGALTEWEVRQAPGSYTSGQRFVTGDSNPYTGLGYASKATPPFHLHLTQTEMFDVQQGTFRYVVHGEEFKLEAGEKASIPPLTPHTFWSDPTSSEDLIVHITVSDGSNDRPGFDAEFVHNFYSYLSSQALQGKGPNLLQMLRMLDHADVVLAGVPFGLGGWVNWLLGRKIGAFLGYPTHFKELAEE